MSQQQQQSSKKISINRFRMRDMRFPSNILIVGPSTTRKNASILRLVDQMCANRAQTVVVTTEPNAYVDVKSPFLEVYAAESSPPALVAKTMKRSTVACRVLENVETPDFTIFDHKRKQTSVIALKDYAEDVPRSASVAIDFVFLFGGIDQKSLRRLWDDFGSSLVKSKDFREIYMACTDESDRYCDDFMVVATGATATATNGKDLTNSIFWSTLRRDATKDITIDIEKMLILNQVFTAEEVALPIPQPLAQPLEAQPLETAAAPTPAAPAPTPAPAPPTQTTVEQPRQQVEQPRQQQVEQPQKQQVEEPRKQVEHQVEEPRKQVEHQVDARDERDPREDCTIL